MKTRTFLIFIDLDSIFVLPKVLKSIKQTFCKCRSLLSYGGINLKPLLTLDLFQVGLLGL